MKVVAAKRKIVVPVRGSAIVPFTGLWDVDIKPTGEARRPIGQMRMGRSGNKVCVTWTWNNARGSGTVSGDTLTYSGTDSFGKGTTKLTSRDGGRAFDGDYETFTHASGAKHTGELFGKRKGDLASPPIC